MDQGALVTEEIDAGAELVHEFNDYMPVVAAFWLKASDEEHRYLYIASMQLNGSNFKAAYSNVLRLVDQLRSPHLDPFRIKLIEGDDPLSKAAIEINLRFPARIPTRFGGNAFGGVSVDEVYIYPTPLQVVAS